MKDAVFIHEVASGLNRPPEQHVGIAVVVKVGEEGAHHAVFHTQAASNGDVFKGAIAAVAEKLGGAPPRGEEQIVMPVAIIVDHAEGWILVRVFHVAQVGILLLFHAQAGILQGEDGALFLQGSAGSLKGNAIGQGGLEDLLEERARGAGHLEFLLLPGGE